MTAAATAPHRLVADRATPGNDTANQVAAAQLATDEHLTYDTALRRILRQPAVDALDLQLQAHDPRFASLWTDQAHGGRIVIQTTAAAGSDTVATLASDALGLKSYVSQRTVRYSLSQLREAYAAVKSRLAGHMDVKHPVTVDIDALHDTVRVDTTDQVGAKPSALQLDLVQTFSARAGLITAGHRPRTYQTSGCNFAYCNAPLRGGVALLEGNLFPPNGYCTEGFNASSTSDLKPYVLTAGHCTREFSGTWYEHQYSDNANHVVGATHPSASTSVDAGIIAVNNPAGWKMPNPYIIVDASNNSVHPTAFNDMYPIARTGYPSIGDYLCRTGATSGTSCGPVTSLSGTIQVHAPVCGGDSGGPVYVSGTAYGIEVAGSGNNGTKVGLNGVAQPCYSYFYATKIGDALSATNVDLDLS